MFNANKIKNPAHRAQDRLERKRMQSNYPIRICISKVELMHATKWKFHTKP